MESQQHSGRERCNSRLNRPGPYQRNQDNKKNSAENGLHTRAPHMGEHDYRKVTT